MAEKIFITPEFEISVNIRQKKYSNLLAELYALRMNEEMSSEEKTAALQSLLKEDDHDEQ